MEERGFFENRRDKGLCFAAHGQRNAPGVVLLQSVPGREDLQPRGLRALRPADGDTKSNHTTLAQSNCRKRSLVSLWRSTLYQSSED